MHICMHICIYIYIHIYTYILHCSQKILESYDMMPELSQRRPAATTTIATDEAGVVISTQNHIA